MYQLPTITWTLVTLAFGALTLAQDDVDQCALSCIADVSGTNCAQAQWSCLCADRAYIERVNNCTYASCNAAQEETTFGAIAQICRVFSYTLTYGPEATAPTSSDEIFSTLGIPSASSLPPVMTSTIQDFPSGSDGYTIATAPPTPSSSISMGSASTTASSASASPTASSTSGSAAPVATSSGAAADIPAKQFSSCEIVVFVGVLIAHVL